ncbi:minor capsid protein [Schleiferilactobacillus harbinensis]|uniref:minor capsid protein n=1 Tax=Schleiferilactobacillus harbinensis TaxID=304207 RepID=UPI0021A3BA03|nr:minor capsid protein [Schleiferilactobacillus harbinensis]MCT2908576.1 minor capsid protein [Schleiferilactobacillus harbinensis]
MNALKTLADAINAIPDMPKKVSMGFLSADESLSIYPTKNGSVVDEDFAGNQETRLYYEIAIRTKDQQLGNTIMWLVSDFVKQLKDLPSDDFQFDKIETTSEPSITQADSRGFFVYTLDVALNVTSNKYKE